MKTAASYTLIFALWAVLFATPLFSLANGGDQRIVENKYLINLSRSPFTPRAQEKTSMLISFVDLEKNKLVAEDLAVKIRIAKLGGIGSEKRTFLFSGDYKVQGGVLELPYTFSETGLHEIFFDFTFASSPEKLYEAPDFLLDVQPPVPQKKLGSASFLIAGIVISLIIGFAVGRFSKIYRSQKRRQGIR